LASLERKGNQPTQKSGKVKVYIGDSFMKVIGNIVVTLFGLLVLTLSPIAPARLVDCEVTEKLVEKGKLKDFRCTVKPVITFLKF
jgi:hypothetical protein